MFVIRKERVQLTYWLLASFVGFSFGHKNLKSLNDTNNAKYLKIERKKFYTTDCGALIEKDEFLNKKVPPKADYVLLDCGMRYLDVQVGTGPEIQLGDTVAVHFVGVSANTNQVVESTQKLGRPVVFRIGASDNDIIEAIHIGVVGMQRGGTRELIVPFKLRNCGSSKEVTVYQVQVLNIVSPTVDSVLCRTGLGLLFQRLAKLLNHFFVRLDGIDPDEHQKVSNAGNKQKGSSEDFSENK